MLYDLHCHSSYSDGELSPIDLVLRAKAAGVHALALTDHDCVAGLSLAQSAADGIHLIPGVELSAGWHGKEIHIVGLFINPEQSVLRDALAQQADRRWQRLNAIADKLRKDHIDGVVEEMQHRFPGALPSRSHVAQILVARGKAKDHERAFTRYIGRKGSAYVPATWPEVPTVVSWIVAASGSLSTFRQ
jgi:predicted metal-dependent phosphoesterase TrpH